MSAWFKFQTHFGVSLQGEWQKYTRLCTVLSKDEGPKNIGDSMNIGNLILGVNGVTVSYLILYGSLLPNATGIITNCERSFLQKRQKFFITKCQLFQLRQLYCNMRQLLQNSTFITNCDSTVIKREVSWAFLFGSGLISIVHWRARSLLFFLFSFFFEIT